MLSWSIVGTGFISTTMIDAIGRSPGSRVELIAGRSRARVDDFRDVYGIARGTTDLAAAAADERVDVVYIATPNHTHHELAIAAATAGKAIVSEKSLTTTMADAEALVAAVRGRVFFVEGLMYLAHPLLGRLTELLTDGALGDLQAADLRYAAPISDVVNPLGGGTIYNLGCYPVSLLQLAVQATSGSEAFRRRRLTGVGNLTDDDTIGAATAAVRFDNGVLASVSSSDEYGMSHHCAFSTDRGELRVETNPWLPVAGDNVITWTPHDGRSETAIVTAEGDGFDAQVRLVERSIDAGLFEVERPSPRLDDSIDVMQFLTDWEARCRS